LQHLNFAGISLEFYIYWHNVASMMDKEYLIWIHGNYHLDVCQGYTGLIILSLYVYAMFVMEFTCCAL